MAAKTWQKGIPLDEALQSCLRALLKERGEEAVAELLGIGEGAIIRAAAGLGLRRGTAFVIETKLALMRRAA